ncbi:sensor histidine kinase [Mucilaginibacter sp. UYCu711]|uniref:sensor histidine kinase n=1 Tax=Mucilaginibacter sp. UYCu711 TaxID=3156339 RepID=UPI003D1EB387
MRYKKLLLLIWLMAGYGASNVALAQWGHELQFQFIETDPATKVEQSVPNSFHDSCAYQVLSYLHPDSRFPAQRPVSPILLGVKLNPTLRHYWMPDVRILSKFYRNFSIGDSSEATVIAIGITKDNIKDYRYRVVENDSVEVVKWLAIPSLGKKFGAKRAYGFIGNFKALNKQLLIEIVNVKDYKIREGVIFDWRKIYQPVVNQISILTPDPFKVHTYPNDPIDTHPNFFNINATKVNRGMATQFDKKTGLPTDMKFNVDSVKFINLYLKDHPAITYTIFILRTANGKSDTTMIAYNFADNMFPVHGKFFNQPGKYQIIVQRASGSNRAEWSDNETLRIPFEVKPPPLTQKKVSIKYLIPYAIAALTGVAILFFAYRRQSNIKLRRAAQEKEIVGLKLQSIRAQLNPHFMFNSLTSIQNLINKNNITGANYYLSKFAGLTRQVLDSSNEEVLSLEDELNVLNDYLQMEQLRFNFKYEIKVDEQLNQANVEIPAMLLQPFAENAIKHGIAGLNVDGMIAITISGEKNDLILAINDNGAGFVKTDQATGYGIKLSKDRVALLNQIYKDQNVTLDIKPTQQGTTVTIRLSNWI